MRNHNTYIRHKILLVTVTILFVVFYSFLAIVGFEVFSERERLSYAADIDALGGRLVPVFYNIDTFSKRAAQEMLFLSKLSSIKNAVEKPNKKTYEELFNDLFTSVQESSMYHEIRYINEQREEKIRIIFDGETYHIVPEDSLENEVTDVYMNNIFTLSEGEVYISKFDLAKRVHPVKNRTTLFQDILVIRFGTPLFSDDGKHEGIIIAEIHADFFLDDVRRLSRDGEQIFLLDQDGQYLVHPEAKKEYGTLLGTHINFANDYPEVAGQVLSQFERRRIESDTTIFSLRHIFPATSNYSLASGSRRLFGENPDRDFFWVLVSAVDKKTIVSDSSIFESYDFFMVFSGIFMTFILGILVIVLDVFRRKNKQT